MRIILFSVVSICGAISNAHAEMSTKELSKYQGTISCVDRIYFDGGYTEDDPDRLAIMDAMLGKGGLPAYNEKLVQKKIETDKASYMAGYGACDANWDFLEAEARKVNVSAEEG